MLSMLFCHNIDEEKKLIPSKETVYVELEVSACLHEFSLGTLASSPILNICMLGELACVHCPSLRECGWECEWLCDRRESCPGWVPTLYPELPV